jgi:tRNA1Val (adenine37-N6)-methyltransferase
MARDKSVFRFRQFDVRHQDTPMKVGTDGVLIGAWAFARPPHSILDIGTGTGLIALMLAQRFPEAHVTGIEVHEAAAKEASLNAAASPFCGRVQMIGADFLEHPFPGKFDAIISNPPYFKDSLLSEKKGKNLARHQDSLEIRQLLEKAFQLLEPEGVLSIILPPAEMEAALFHARMSGGHIVRQCMVSSKSGQQAVRVMTEWSRAMPTTPSRPQQLVIYQEDLSYTEEYRDLTAAFYLQDYKR